MTAGPLSRQESFNHESAQTGKHENHEDRQGTRANGPSRYPRANTLPANAEEFAAAAEELNAQAEQILGFVAQPAHLLSGQEAAGLGE
jgi:hypothetical protein